MKAFVSGALFGLKFIVEVNSTINFKLLEVSRKNVLRIKSCCFFLFSVSHSNKFVRAVTNELEVCVNDHCKYPGTFSYLSL